MRRLLLILALCIHCAARAQTGYEYYYWFDADTTNQYALNPVQGAAEIDISALKDGLHFLHVMVRNAENGETSVTRTALFWKQVSLASRKCKLWFDRDYANAMKYEHTGNPFVLDVALLEEGFHFLNLQVEGEINSSTVTRMFVKMPVLNETQTLECIINIDGREYKREKVANGSNVVNCTLDVNDLSVGLHKAYVMVTIPSGTVCSMKEAFFYRAPTHTEVAGMQLLYAIDDGEYQLAGAQVGNGLYQIDVDVANLEKGEHRITCIMIGADGMQTPPVTGTFLTGYYDLKYYVDGEVVDSLCLGAGDEIPYREGEPTKEGYVFIGWDGLPEIMPSHDVTVNAKFIQKGDVDVNGNVTVGDVVITGNYILKRNPEVFYFKAADINRDAEITMSDVVAIVDIVLDGKDTETANRTRSCISGLELGKATVKHEIATIPMNLANNTPYSAFQADVVLPEGIALESATLAARAQGTHRVTWKKQANGRVRILVYAADNAAFRGNAGELVALNLSGFSIGDPELDVHMENVIFATPEGHENFMDNATSIINPTNSGMMVYARGGTLFVESDEEQTLHLYNLQGQLVKVLHIQKGMNTYANLPAGVYILNGVKVVIDK